jgi:hypothetical protein
VQPEHAVPGQTQHDRTIVMADDSGCIPKSQYGETTLEHPLPGGIAAVPAIRRHNP